MTRRISLGPGATALAVGVAAAVLAQGVASVAGYAYWSLLVLTPDALTSGEWWRLVTYALVHGNTAHAAMNVAGVAILGHVVERRYGVLALLSVFLVGVVAAGLVPLTTGIAVGASGGVFALGYALLMGEWLERRDWLVLVVLLVGVPFDAAIGNVMLAASDTNGRIGWGSHAAGAVAGVVAALLLHRRRTGSTTPDTCSDSPNGSALSGPR